MRDILKNQLKQCQVADLSSGIETDDSIIIKIPKFKGLRLEIGEQALVRVADELISTAGNTGPRIPYLKIYVSKLDGKLAYVDSLGFDFEHKKDLMITWSGWLPLDKIELIARL